MKVKKLENLIKFLNEQQKKAHHENQRQIHLGNITFGEAKLIYDNYTDIIVIVRTRLKLAVAYERAENSLFDDSISQ